MARCQNQTWKGSKADIEFAFEYPSPQTSVAEDKAAILQVAAALDRGQAYNPTAGTYYNERMQEVTRTIEQFLEHNPDKIPTSIQEMEGEWELVMHTVPSGLYRASLTFLAVQDSYETYGEQQKLIHWPKWAWAFGEHPPFENTNRLFLFFARGSSQALENQQGGSSGSLNSTSITTGHRPFDYL